MKRFAAFLIAVFSIAAGILMGARCAAAQAWSQPWAVERLEKSPRHHEWVTVKHDGRSVEAFVVYPESKDKTPVVLIIHEIFGMSDWVQDLADQVAAAGYIAVAPDLLSGMAPNGGRTSDLAQDKVTEAVSHLNPEQVTADLSSVADYAKKLPASNGKLLAAGFCWVMAAVTPAPRPMASSAAAAVTAIRRRVEGLRPARCLSSQSRTVVAPTVSQPGCSWRLGLSGRAGLSKLAWLTWLTWRLAGRERSAGISRSARAKRSASGTRNRSSPGRVVITRTRSPPRDCQTKPCAATPSAVPG